MLGKLVDWMMGSTTQTASLAVQPHLIETTTPMYGLGDVSPVVGLPAHAQYTDLMTTAVVGSWVPDNGVYVHGIPMPQVVSGGTAPIRDTNAPDGGC